VPSSKLRLLCFDLLYVPGSRVSDAGVLIIDVISMV